MQYIIYASTALQFLTSFMALRLMRITGKRLSWALISAAAFGMALRRSITLYDVHFGTAPLPVDTYDIIGLATSALMFSGVVLIGPLFREIADAREKLEESEERFRTMAEFTWDWEYWLGPDGKFRYVSPSCERITGHDREEFISDPSLLTRLIHPADRENAMRRIHAGQDTAGQGTVDFRVVRGDGRVVWVAHNCTPVHSASGEYLGVRASIRDITHRKSIEAELRKSRRKYRELVQASRSIVMKMDLEGNITFFNEYARRFFGYSEDEIIGRNVLGTIVPRVGADGRDMRRVLNALLRSKACPPSFESENMRRDGTRVWVSWANSPILDEEGRRAGYLCVGIDATERMEAERMREHVERLIRHDLKSPLMGIIGIPRLIRKSPKLSPRDHELLEAVEDAGQRMLELIDMSRNLYLMETDAYELQPAPARLPDLVRKAAGNLLAYNRQFDGGEAFTIDCPEGTPDVLGEETLLFSMFSNLLKNAAEASTGRTPVHVEVRHEEHMVRASIRNDIPVPEDVRETFFDKYATYGKTHGTGLGTYSARLIAELHGGKIEMETSEEEGTTVTVRLPTKN